MQEIVHSETREYADGTHSTSSFDADGKLVSLEIRQACSGRNPAFDEGGRLMLTPELERAIEERVRAGIAQFACALLDAIRGSGDLTLASYLERWLSPPAASVLGIDPVKPGSEVAVVFYHGDLFESMRTPSPERWARIAELLRSGTFLAFCNTCDGTGYDFSTRCPCPDCAQPNNPTPRQAQDLPEAPEWAQQAVAKQDAPSAPRSVCCQAETFEADGRRVCSKCRLTRPL